MSDLFAMKERTPTDGTKVNLNNTINSIVSAQNRDLKTLRCWSGFNQNNIILMLITIIIIIILLIMLCYRSGFNANKMTTKLI